MNYGCTRVLIHADNSLATPLFPIAKKALYHFYQEECQLQQFQASAVCCGAWFVSSILSERTDKPENFTKYHESNVVLHVATDYDMITL